MSIGIGILGFAHGHVNMYCTEWRKNPAYDMNVVAGWDHDAGRVAQAAKNFELQACATPEELLALPNVQAVVVSAETSLHAELVEKAAAAGKMIIVQKPIALTMPEADRIVAAVQRYSVPFTIAWQMRVDPQNVQMKELMQSGELGKIFMVRRRHGLSTHVWQPPFADMWHAKPELNRDIWADDAAHAIDFLHWMLGVPETVTAEVESLCNPVVPNDNGIAIYRYPGGPLAEVFCSFTCVAAENTTEVFAEKGSIIQNYGDGVSCNPAWSGGLPGLKWFTTAKNAWTPSDIASPASHGARIGGLSGPLAQFLHGERGPIATAEEGRTTLRMTLATYVSTREGRRVRLDDPAIASV